MNIPVLSIENAQNASESNPSVLPIGFKRVGKFINSSQKEAYRKKALQEIRKALNKARDF